MKIKPLTGQISSEEMAHVRQVVYGFLLSALDKPTPQQHAWLCATDFQATLTALCEQFDLPVPTGELFPTDFSDYESRYLACFEVGVPEPPVVLLASHYLRHEPVPRIIHEHVLLYKKFGVKLGDDNSEPADHLVNELAFLSRLDELLLREGVETESVLRARRDFLVRHVARWPAQAAESAVQKHLPSVYCALLRLVAAAVEQDCELTEHAVSDVDKEQR